MPKWWIRARVKWVQARRQRRRRKCAVARWERSPADGAMATRHSLGLDVWYPERPRPRPPSPTSTTCPVTKLSTSADPSSRWTRAGVMQIPASKPPQRRQQSPLRQSSREPGAASVRLECCQWCRCRGTPWPGRGSPSSLSAAGPPSANPLLSQRAAPRVLGGGAAGQARAIVHGACQLSDAPPGEASMRASQP